MELRGVGWYGVVVGRHAQALGVEHGGGCNWDMLLTDWVLMPRRADRAGVSGHGCGGPVVGFVKIRGIRG